MKFLNAGSIRSKLTLLVILAVLPALIILLYSGLEQRQQSIENAKREVLLLTHTMAQAQQEITRSTRQILSTLSLLPAIQALDIQASSDIFRAVLEQNPNYNNIVLINLNGDVLASGRTFAGTNLADRKHIKEALSLKTFTVGEFIISRGGDMTPIFPFAYPVFDKKGKIKAILTTAVKLTSLSAFHDVSALPEKSFIAITDHQGIRLFYYPAQEKTNPVGKPIQAKVWEKAGKDQEPKIILAKGSDGLRRIISFEQVRLNPEDTPYLYVWAGIPEAHIIAPANDVLSRNLLLMLLATVISLFISWLIGNNTILSPIQNLMDLTRKFAQGDLKARSEEKDRTNEFATLTKAFHDMAEALALSQKSMQDNEARFRLVMDGLDALVYVADMDTYEVLFINEYAQKKFGDIIGKTCWQSLQQGQNGPCPFCTNKYLIDGAGNPTDLYSWEFQNTVTKQWLYITDRAIKWLDGRIVRLEVATDISKRKLAETRLAEETERLAVTLRSIGDGVITTDMQGRILLFNKAAETLTGWQSKEATGLPLAEVFTIINDETRQPCRNPVEKVLTSGEKTDSTSHFALITKSGQEKTITENCAPIKDKNGKIIGVVLVFRDITEQLRTEKELIKIKKLESVGVLAGGIAHDFNNILTAILGNIDLSLLDLNLTEKTRKLLKEAVQASYRAKGLTQQLLTFAKGGAPIKKAASLPEVVKDSADFVLRGTTVSCSYFFPDDLWFADIDTNQISQVVQNIVLNAIAAMPDGGNIEISCENVGSATALSLALPKTGNYVKMQIKDSGVGIAPTTLDKIFDPYFSTKQQGSGLGLAVTHSIISKHGGHISVQSTLGLGTTFTTYLPASTQYPVSVKNNENTSLNAKKIKILVMDDEEQVRDITEAMLSRMGHDVVLAKDGLEAIRLYKEAKGSNSPIDVTIMDLTIPGGMGGKDAVKEVLVFDPDAKIIVSSGYSNDPIIANCQKYGFCAAIVKPFQLQELIKVINQVME